MSSLVEVLAAFSLMRRVLPSERQKILMWWLSQTESSRHLGKRCGSSSVRVDITLENGEKVDAPTIGSRFPMPVQMWGGIQVR